MSFKHFTPCASEPPSKAHKLSPCIVLTLGICQKLRSGISERDATIATKDATIAELTTKGATLEGGAPTEGGHHSLSFTTWARREGPEPLLFFCQVPRLQMQKMPRLLH